MSDKKHPSYYTIHNKLELVKGGSEYFELLRNLVAKAKHSIYIRMYIWDNDETGREVAECLVEAAKRNVAVFVTADGYASQSLPRLFIKNLQDHGIHFRYFEPLLRSTHFYFGRRLHEKIVAIDGTDALVGGINLANHYNDMGPTPAWLDYALHVQGEAAYKLLTYCAADWQQQMNVILPTVPVFPKDNECSVRISRNDWVKRKNNIWKTYFDWFNIAEKNITIMCSYFLPGLVLRNRLINAAKRGVKVKIILAGPSDVMLAKHAERYLYPQMLKNGIEIYEYQPTVLHAKMMVVDDHWVTIGSFNVNNVSSYASMELNLDVRNKPFAKSIHQILHTIIENQCTKVTEKSFAEQTSFFKMLLQKASYGAIRTILNLSTFYFKHE